MRINYAIIRYNIMSIRFTIDRRELEFDFERRDTARADADLAPTTDASHLQFAPRRTRAPSTNDGGGSALLHAYELE